MIDSFYLKTFEIDDKEYAVEELLKQLEGKKLLKNTIGIVSCHADYIKEGIVAEFASKISFNIVGATSCLIGSKNECDRDILVITVLTSDTIEFVSSVSDDLSSNYEEKVAATYNNIKLEGKLPALVLTFAPLMSTLSGDFILDVLAKTSENKVPFFGTLSLDHTRSYSNCYTINGTTANKCLLVLLAFYGDLDYEIKVASVKNIIDSKEKAIITKSKGNLLIEVNKISAENYMTSLGLSHDQLTNGLGLIPLVVNYNDDNDAASRAVFGISPEGYLICGAEMPENTTLSVGSINYFDVISTSTSAISEIPKTPTVVIGFSCMARYLVLGANVKEEYKLFSNYLKNEDELIFAYSGGEICPTKNSDSTYNNHLHNYSLVLLYINK